MNAPYRTWIDVDLDAIIRNYRTACSLTDSVVTCVLKSNAYGHGAVMVAKCLQEAGCRSFAVSCIREGIELRQNGISGEVLIMGAGETSWLQRAIMNDLTLTASSLAELDEISDAAERMEQAASVHLKINTGFHRLGFDCTRENAAAIGQFCREHPQVQVKEAFSHLGLINLERDTMQHDQLVRFAAWLEEENVLPKENIHLCDSIGLVRYPDWHGCRVRVGALLFGVRPPHSEHLPFENPETLVFRASLAQIHDVPAGEIVGYGDDVILTRDSRIATICAGYGDGYPRCLSNGRGSVFIRGSLAPVVGLVCMDQMMVDVTDIPDAAVGDAADLLGGAISYDVMAKWQNTNRNECISILSRRPVRVYHQHGRRDIVVDELISGEGDA